MFSHKWIKKQSLSSTPQIDIDVFAGQLVKSIAFAESLSTKETLLILGSSGSGKTKFIQHLPVITTSFPNTNTQSDIDEALEEKFTVDSYLPRLTKFMEESRWACEISGVEEKNNTPERFLFLLNTILATKMPQGISGIVITVDVNALCVDRAAPFDTLLGQLTKFLDASKIKGNPSILFVFTGVDNGNEELLLEEINNYIVSRQSTLRKLETSPLCPSNEYQKSILRLRDIILMAQSIHQDNLFLIPNSNFSLQANLKQKINSLQGVDKSLFKYKLKPLMANQIPDSSSKTLIIALHQLLNCISTSCSPDELSRSLERHKKVFTNYRENEREFQQVKKDKTIIIEELQPLFQQLLEALSTQDLKSSVTQIEQKAAELRFNYFGRS
ncbi:hypothetical protein Lqui_0219 [Legionella quinlivanii]|uniref:Uncharacterized protein n=1 Tax=Legionella quinlivanii TaxID=45073 RepID=A0A0W0Y3U4_9GAMM|nr:hypothetical protein [Legionella quinlivanii]KTD51375.1 hypothetical protein Lqui_0219 [Legionella quinlivanii]SEG12503.1 hypothetical protein SAMN02746093_01957 [Legionella quinlivanii DSM 21216]STY10135.1 Uncharacterised protein [Legionella quinlivanii]